MPRSLLCPWTHATTLHRFCASISVDMPPHNVHCVRAFTSCWGLPQDICCNVVCAPGDMSSCIPRFATQHALHLAASGYGTGINCALPWTAVVHMSWCVCRGEWSSVCTFGKGRWLAAFFVQGVIVSHPSLRMHPWTVVRNEGAHSTRSHKCSLEDVVCGLLLSSQ